MTITKKSKKKVSKRKKSNPGILSKLFSKSKPKKRKPGTYTVGVESGTITLSGNRIAEQGGELEKLLGSNNLKVEFEPDDSDKVYTLNMAGGFDIDTDDEDMDTAARIRHANQLRGRGRSR